MQIAPPARPSRIVNHRSQQDYCSNSTLKHVPGTLLSSDRFAPIAAERDKYMTAARRRHQVLSAALSRVVPGSHLHNPSGERSEEHTSELQSLMRISYAVFCLKKKKKTTTQVASM